MQSNPTMREFATGATRNADQDKLDFDGFESPLVMERFARYMHEHRKQADGKLRESDNWQRGIPFAAYMKSLWRHFFDVWKYHRGLATPEDIETNLCALLFNAKGYLHEHLKAKAGQLQADANLLKTLRRKAPWEAGYFDEAVDTSAERVQETAKSVHESKLHADLRWDAMECGHEQPLPGSRIITPAESAHLASFSPNEFPILSDWGIGDVPHVAQKATSVADPHHSWHHITLNGPESRL